ncbi:unnamed protein product [Sphenostylis stenocarpa]|uniref:Uncharacterized protein n=1 Tax=Sphenostylis stenocarpa TaxID=92480 RepID=A0AA86S0C3_9FABA|nr:unnamed protein product [Sphenostylis stenocarpa]
MEEDFGCRLKVLEGTRFIASCNLVQPPRCCLPYVAQSFLVVECSKYSKSKTSWNHLIGVRVRSRDIKNWGSVAAHHTDTKYMQ